MTNNYTIAGREFKTKASLQREAKRIRDQHDLRSPLKGIEFTFIRELFERLDPNWAARAKSPVMSIQVIFVQGGRCFSFILQDGTVFQPSLNKLFEGKLSVDVAEVRSCMRGEAFFDWCRPYRDRYFAQFANERGLAPCELTGELVGKDGCDIDHLPPDSFKIILDDFLTLENLTLMDVQLIDAPSGLGKQMADRQLAARWLSYHRKRAKLRVLARSVHVELTRQDQIARAPKKLTL